ncbi:MAG: hypothetical protein AB9919_04515 [Geobacteraceae bacterium]
MSHLFFSNALQEAWLHALDTHPPLEDRIRRLDASFNGKFPAVEPLPAPPPLDIYLKPQPPKSAPTPAIALSGAEVTALLSRAGDPMQEHIDRARHLIGELPEQLISAIHDPFGACVVVYGLLLNRTPDIRARQEEFLRTQGEETFLEEIRRIAPFIGTLPAEVRLPLLELSLPALRALSQKQFSALKATVEHLSSADKKTSLFEFTLRYLLLRHLEPNFSQHPTRPAQIYGLRGVQHECSCVLTALARIGHQDEMLARQAFERGLIVLQEAKTDFSFLPAAECGVACLEQAFGALESTSPLIKRRLLGACLECLRHDGTVTVAEAELFRAIADAIGCPLPPWLESAHG